MEMLFVTFDRNEYCADVTVGRGLGSDIDMRGRD